MDLRRTLVLLRQKVRGLGLRQSVVQIIKSCVEVQMGPRWLMVCHWGWQG